MHNKKIRLFKYSISWWTYVLYSYNWVYLALIVVIVINESNYTLYCDTLSLCIYL